MQFTQGPVLTLSPNATTPLGAILEFATDTPATATVEVDDGANSWTLPVGGSPATEHRYPVLGLRPGVTHRVSVTATGPGGDGVTGDGLEMTAPPLPDDFPPITVTTCVAERREPGVTMFNIRYSPAGGDLPEIGLIVGVDRAGDIVWYHTHEVAIGDVRRLRNGNLLYVAEGRIREIDLLGNVVNDWYAAGRFEGDARPTGATAVAAKMFHHACIELPSGNLLACSIEIRDLDDYPTDEADPDRARETAHVVGDVIVEFQRDGTVVHDYKLLDLLDPYRICYGSLAGYWVRRGYPDTRDWSHVNGLAFDPSDDSFVASVRHQDCIIKIDRETGELRWILGDHTNWKDPWAAKLLAPADGVAWQYHQHDCSVTGAGTVMCFDNGNHRATPPGAKMAEAESYSRAVEFAIDAGAGAVRQIWAYGDGADRVFSAYQSGAYRLPETGNTLIDYGGVCTIDGVASGRIDEGHCKARLLEVTAGDVPEIVFELFVNDSAANGPRPLSSFRGEHLPSLYPSGG